MYRGTAKQFADEINTFRKRERERNNGNIIVIRDRRCTSVVTTSTYRPMPFHSTTKNDFRITPRPAPMRASWRDNICVLLRGTYQAIWEGRG